MFWKRKKQELFNDDKKSTLKIHLQEDAFHGKR